MTDVTQPPLSGFKKT